MQSTPTEHDFQQPFAEGHMLLRRFRIRKILGRGWFGITYLTLDTEENAVLPPVGLVLTCWIQEITLCAIFIPTGQ
ncbi:hypothetical protein [Desulfonatronovibrio magnus]|uniref:hypothetical protein n=1 Tax=Desulfonatronovibrio magnus TaxID=698827 RepID=UPI0005EB481B|nr:hypothetical protein [Desulfonatronovibrio magnus]